MSHQKSEIFDPSTLVMYGFSKGKQGLVIELTKEEQKQILYFINSIHNGVIRAIKVEDLEYINLKIVNQSPIPKCKELDNV